MKFLKNAKSLLILLAAGLFTIYLTSCSENVSTDTQTDDEFLTEVVTKGYSTVQDDDDNLMSSESGDLDDGGPVYNGGGGDTPIDSLIKWGRKIVNVNLNLSITSEGDTIKNVLVTRTITGNFIIIGMVNNVQDTIVKPYTEVLKRTIVFKRVNRTNRPRFNWRLYKVSMVDGQTTSPQIGSDYVRMDKIEVYVNGVLKTTYLGPDFTQNIFTTKWFGGTGIPDVHVNDQVKLVVYTYSTQSEQDIVAWHWARNTFGFHREPFTMTSNNPSGSGWNRTYEKTFTIYSNHKPGVFNGFISASTHKSLYDDSPSEFASDLVGTAYRVK